MERLNRRLEILELEINIWELLTWNGYLKLEKRIMESVLKEKSRVHDPLSCPSLVYLRSGVWVYG